MTNAAGTLKLSREEVQTKYGPTPDPLWTDEVADAFLASIPKASYRDTLRPSEAKEILIRDFGTATLKAKRMSADYVHTLGAILGDFYDAGLIGGECLVSQRDTSIGTARTIRTIQGQMHQSGHLVKETRSQGHGFVGDVFVHTPRPQYRRSKTSEAYLNESYRRFEGECPYLTPPANLCPEDVPFWALNDSLIECT
jgi:hypothetical protein